jgi:hypothetical protein
MATNRNDVRTSRKLINRISFNKIYSCFLKISSKNMYPQYSGFDVDL